jgi:hypothetical protein
VNAALLHRIDTNTKRLQLHTLAYNLADFLRSLATPLDIDKWSLPSRCEQLIKTGAPRPLRRLSVRRGCAAEVGVYQDRRNDQQIARAAHRDRFHMNGSIVKSPIHGAGKEQGASRAL